MELQEAKQIVRELAFRCDKQGRNVVSSEEEQAIFVVLGNTVLTENEAANLLSRIEDVQAQVDNASWGDNRY